jgi:transposase-like protein
MTAFEKETIVEALHESAGDIAAAAKKLGMERGALDVRLKALQLVTPAAAPPSKPVDPAATKPPDAPPSDWKSVQV